MPEGPTAPDPAALAGALDVIEAYLLSSEPSMTRIEIADRAGVEVDLASHLWRLMGFPETSDDDIAFTEADLDALVSARELIDLGILGTERQDALVRTWGRSYARLAEWQTALLASMALEKDAEPGEIIEELTREVLPRVESLQSYVWRRHLVSAGGRMLAVADPSSPTVTSAVVFVDIVGYTSRSKTLSETELVEWIEAFESTTLDLVTARGGRIIKNIGDEVLFVTDDVESATAIAVEMTRRGADDDDPFPDVRAGVSYGDVVNRLGDVFGPTVNIASRLTSAARPGTVLVDQGAHDVLRGDEEGGRDAGGPAYDLHRVRRLSVKGYSRLAAWVLRPPR